ncbi:hypothetical protein FKM82_017743, partial [Ascaphus truei]
IHFQKECGTDNVCNSNLHIQYEYLWESQDPLPRVNGTQILRYNPDVNKLNLQVTVTNAPSATSEGDDAHGAVLNITVPPQLVYAAVRPVSLWVCGGDGGAGPGVCHPVRRYDKKESAGSATAYKQYVLNKPLTPTTSSTYHLRSDSNRLFMVPRFSKVSGRSSSSYRAPQNWNSLPETLTAATRL